MVIGFNNDYLNHFAVSFNWGSCVQKYYQKNLNIGP
jgi:hypothetical protein